MQVQGEIQEIVKTGLWVGDCFIYTSSVNRLNYFVGGEIVTIAHLDRCVSVDNFVDFLNVTETEICLVAEVITAPLFSFVFHKRILGSPQDHVPAGLHP